MGGAREAASQVLPHVLSEKDGRAGTAVLPDVRQLVGKQQRAFDRIRRDERRRRRGEEHPPAEDDRIGAGQGRQDPRRKTAVEAGANELAGEFGAKALSQGGRDRDSEQTTTRRGSSGARQSASTPPCSRPGPRARARSRSRRTCRRPARDGTSKWTSRGAGNPPESGRSPRAESPSRPSRSISL